MNKSKFQIKSAIMAAAMLLMTSNFINGLYGTIATNGAFAGTPPDLLIMVLTLPFLVGMVFSVLAGPIAKVISKKITTLLGITIILLAGIVALLNGKANLSFLLTSSVLFGVGQGLLATLTMALPADYFEGQERASLMGLQSSFVSFGGMAIAFIGALLSGIDWYYAYLVTFITAPILLVVLTNLPSKEPVQVIPEAEDAAGTEAPQKGSMVNAFVITILIIDMLYASFMFTFTFNYSLFMTSHSLGTITTAGLVQSLTSAMGGVAGILYGRMFKGMKSQLAPFAMVITAFGYLLVVFFGNMPSIFIAGILSGFGLTCAIPTFFYNVSNNVPPATITTALGILNGAGCLAIFLSPKIVGAVTSIVMPEATIEGKFIVASVALQVLAVVSFFIFRSSDKKAAA